MSEMSYDDAAHDVRPDGGANAHAGGRVEVVVTSELF